MSATSSRWSSCWSLIHCFALRVGALLRSKAWKRTIRVQLRANGSEQWRRSFCDMGATSSRQSSCWSLIRCFALSVEALLSSKTWTRMTRVQFRATESECWRRSFCDMSATSSRRSGSWSLIHPFALSVLVSWGRVHSAVDGMLLA